MSFGIIEVISLLLGLSGFGLQANPKAPTADQSLQYAMPDADVVMHFDAASVIPGNYKVLQNLPNQPQIKASAELSKMVRQMIGEIEGARGIAKTATGIDFTTDLNDMTVFLQIVPQHDPNFVAVVHGKFSTALVEKVAKMGKGTVQQTTNGMILDMGPDDPSVAVTKDGVLIAGTANLVRDRLADGWKAPARAPGSNLSFTADVINAKPVYALVMTLSAAARAAALKNMGGQNLATDLVQRHKQASFSMFHDGVGWTWVDSSKAGMESMAMMSDGVMDMLKAAQIAPRGFAKLMLGALDSYRGTDKRIDDLIRHKADLMKLVETYTGDGNFKVQIDKDPKTYRVTARATGKALSEVVPIGFMLPGAAAALVFRGAPAPMSPPPAIAVPPPGKGQTGGKKSQPQPQRRP
jgi:hypothetical protein